MSNNIRKLNSFMKKSARTPKVTVLMPVYNGAAYLEEAILSVLNNSYDDYELVLINDGSKDTSEQICRRLADKHNQIRYFTFKKNKGLVAALNFGLKKARGTYICRLNQDDRMLPHRIKTQVAYLDKHQDVAVVGSWIRLLHIGKKDWSETIRYLEKDEQIKQVWHILSPFSDPAVMYRKEVALSLEGYDEDFFIAEDSHMWIRMGTVGKLANIPEILTEVRFHDEATTYSNFKYLMQTTYKLHRWMHENVQEAPLHIQAFWLMQLGAGLVLPPQVVFGIYRTIKRSINFFKDVQFDFRRNYLPDLR